MARVDYRYRQVCRRQFSNESQLHSTSGFQHHQVRCQLTQASHQVGDSLRIIGDLPCLTAGTKGYIQAVSGNIDPHVQWQLLHSTSSPHSDSSVSGPALLNSDSLGPLNCSGSETVGRDDPAELRSLQTQDETVCHARWDHFTCGTPLFDDS